MAYVAFISYKHSPTSRLQAEALEQALKRYAKPLWRPPIAIFRDERVLRPGDDLPAARVGHGLVARNQCIGFCHPTGTSHCRRAVIQSSGVRTGHGGRNIAQADIQRHRGFARLGNLQGAAEDEAKGRER